MNAAERVHLTEDEYLELERASDTKHEYIHGEVVAMAGGSPEHSLIASNINRALGNRLEGRPCVVLTSDQRVHVRETGMYTYPDVVVACGRPQFHDKDPHSLVNPVLIVEVLSESTEAHDRGPKFAHYRNLPTLQEYLLVAQDGRRVEHYRRIEPRRWVLTEYIDEGDVELPSLDCSLSLAEIYAKIELLRGGDGRPGA